MMIFNFLNFPPKLLMSDQDVVIEIIDTDSDDQQNLDELMRETLNSIDWSTFYEEFCNQDRRSQITKTNENQLKRKRVDLDHQNTNDTQTQPYKKKYSSSIDQKSKIKRNWDGLDIFVNKIVDEDDDELHN